MDNKKQKAFWKVIISLFLFSIFAFSLWFQSVQHPNDLLWQKLAKAFGGFISLCIPGLLFGGLALIIFKKINFFANTFIICSLITVYFAYVGLAARMGNPLMEVVVNKAVQTIKPKLPMKVDEKTTWQDVYSEGATLFFEYIFHEKKEDIDVQNFSNKMGASLNTALCENEEYLSHLRSGASYNYNYKTDDNLELANFYFDNKSCN